MRDSHHSNIGRLCAIVALASGCSPSGSEAVAALPINAMQGPLWQTDEDGQRFGSLTINGAIIQYDGGLELSTQPIGQVLTGSDRIAQSGPTFAEIYKGRSDVNVELRRVSKVRAGRGGDLCAPAGTTFVAIAYKTPPSIFALIPFSGPDAPGTGATNSRACGVHYLSAPGPGRGDPAAIWRAWNENRPLPY